METMYLTHPACRLHEMGSWHPESPQRLDAISDQLLASGLMPYLDDRQAKQQSMQQNPQTQGLYESIRQMDKEKVTRMHWYSDPMATK